MIRFVNILLFVLSISLSGEVFSQSNKDKKLAKDSLIELIHNDSMMLYLKNKDGYNTQEDTNFKVFETIAPNGNIAQMTIIDGDTVYLFTLEDFKVVELSSYGDVEKDKQLRRLKYHVTKVYPYAKIAVDKFNQYSVEIENVKSKSKKRKLLKQREQELKEEFTEVIKKLTVTQGRILVKLIDRGTGESTYDIIKEMRGGFKAFIYQGVAKLYSGDLKSRYDPKNNEEDEMIERIVQSLEAGQ
ncbi:MAG TPA: DUF4294 domain-containing protein [Vicingaceae bacterium]